MPNLCQTHKYDKMSYRVKKPDKVKILIFSKQTGIFFKKNEL